MPVEVTIPAEGELGVQMFYSPVPFAEDRFAETLEIRPGNRAVVHHAGVFVVDIPEGAKIVNGRLIAPDGKAATDRGEGLAGRADTTALPGANKLLSWVPGRVGDCIAQMSAENPAGKCINWQALQPTGKPEKDRTRLGIWFNKVPAPTNCHPPGRRSAGDDEGRPSLYRAEGKEVSMPADEGSTRRRGGRRTFRLRRGLVATGITPVTEDITRQRCRRTCPRGRATGG
jgi:hypothetical protein